ncbi:uncharacterized protein LJ206_012485 isoform 2-T2 [Theristicus caerulescens]
MWQHFEFTSHHSRPLVFSSANPDESEVLKRDKIQACGGKPYLCNTTQEYHLTAKTYNGSHCKTLQLHEAAWSTL